VGYNCTSLLTLQTLHILADDDEIKLQASVDKFVKWAEEWLFKINYSKCKVMPIMHRGQRVINDTVYHIKDTILEKVDKFKDLGYSLIHIYYLIATLVKKSVKLT